MLASARISSKIFLSAHSKATLLAIEVRITHISTQGAQLRRSEADLYEMKKVRHEKFLDRGLSQS